LSQFRRRCDLVEKSILTDDFLRQLISVGEVDLLVAVPTYNNIKTVSAVVEATRAGLVKHFPRERAVIVNADGGSRDGTPDIVISSSISDSQGSPGLYTLRTLHCISTTYAGGPSSETALRTILAAAELVRARACTVISPGSTSADPDRVERLLRPVYRENFDFVAPVYRRHKFDGLLVRSLVYPMTRALYGQRIREPYAADFAFSDQFCGHFLERQSAAGAATCGAAEICLAITAVAEGLRVCQSFLGDKPNTGSDSVDLVDAIRETVGGLFGSLEPYFTSWSGDRPSEEIPTFGAMHETADEPMRVQRRRLYQMYRLGVAELEPVLKSILSPQTLLQVQAIAGLSEEEFRYTDELWVKTVYEFAASYHRPAINRDHIIQALAPLYRGKVYTFLIENRDASSQEVESDIEGLCLTFEQLKPYLLALWNA